MVNLEKILNSLINFNKICNILSLLTMNNLSKKEELVPNCVLMIYHLLYKNDEKINTWKISQFF